MADTPSQVDRETLLLARIAQLEAGVGVSRATASPNLVDELWRYFKAFIPMPILAAGLAIFLLFHGWEWTFDAQMKAVETRYKQADAALNNAKTNANAAPGVDGNPVQVETFLAALKKKQAEASRAKTEADAQNALIDDETLRLQSIKAEVAKKQALASKARAAADAARAREGLLTLESEAARVKLMSTEIQAIAAHAEAASGPLLQSGDFGQVPDLICANKYAALFGCPASYVRRFGAVAPANAPKETPSDTEVNNGPSFDCSRARAADEQTICGSAELGRIDRQMAKAFKGARARNNARAMQVGARMFSDRRACGSDAACIRDAMLAAINQYRQQ